MTIDHTIQYQEMAKILISELPSKWDKAWIKAVTEDSAIETSYFYQAELGSEKWLDPNFSQTDKASDALMSIRESMTIPGQKPWSRCTFTLFPDGTFKFDVEYDD